MYHFKIITADKSVLQWQSLERKRQAIEDTLNTVHNGFFKVDIVYQDVGVPEVVDGRITRRWFDSISSRVVDFTALHMTEAQRTTWGIQSSLRGSNFRDDDDTGEMYFWADENTRRGRKFNQFIETALHELRHELMKGCNYIDDTHDVHGTDGTLTDAFRGMDMRRYRPTRSVWKELLRQALYLLIDKYQGKKKA